MKPGNIELYVEELVLHGFSPADRYRIGQAVERELTRLLAQEGVPPSLIESSALERVAARDFEWEVGAKAETIGTNVAQAVYEGMTGWASEAF